MITVTAATPYMNLRWSPCNRPGIRNSSAHVTASACSSMPRISASTPPISQPMRPLRSHAKMQASEPATHASMKMYMRAVCEYSIISGSNATVAARAIFHCGRRKRRPRDVAQINRRDAAQRRRQTERPFGLAEDLHRRGHEIQLAQAARIEHAARQDRPAVLHDVHGGHRHRFFVAVQAGTAEIPEAHDSADAKHDAEQHPVQHSLFRRGQGDAEQARECAHEFGDRGVHYRR